MTGLLHKAKHYLFGYDAVESKNRRQAPTGRLRSEDKELLPHQRRKLTSASRDIHRNFTIAAWAIRKHLDYVSTFAFQSRTGSADLDGRIEDLMDWWSRPTNCDVAARHSLPRLVRLSGGFKNVSVPALGGGLSWDTSDLYAGGTIMVAPEPATLALVAMGTAGTILGNLGTQYRFSHRPCPLKISIVSLMALP